MNERAKQPLALSAAATIGMIVGLSMGGVGVEGGAYQAPDGVQMTRAELRVKGDEVAVYYCFRLETSPGIFSTGCPDAPLIDFQKNTPSASDIRKAFVALHQVKK